MNSLLHTLKQKIRALSIAVMRRVIRQPQLKEITLWLLNKTPVTKAYFNNIALSAGLSTKQYSEISLSEFNHSLGHVAIADVAAKKITDSNYFTTDIATKLCVTYELNFDFDLIDKIRMDQQIDYVIYSDDKLNISIAHFYLALLYRFPSDTEIKQSVDNVSKHNSFAPLMQKIKGSAEYQQRGYHKLML